MSIKKLRRPVFLLSVLYVCIAVQAQKKDTLTVLRDFVNVSNAYKQIPLHLSLEMKNSTNYITGEDDTSTVRAEFYIKNEGSYVRFGEFEQVVNDSMALLVSDKLQQMILYTDAGPIISRMRNMMGTSLPDSSVRNMAGKYISSCRQLSNESSIIELQSRAFVYGTSLPKETIELQYDPKNKLPQQVLTTTRSLLPLDSLQYTSLQSQPGIAGKLLALEGSYFLIREQMATFIYKKIEQASASKVPVVITDRIMRTEEGEYKPVKKYETYLLTQDQ